MQKMVLIPTLACLLMPWLAASAQSPSGKTYTVSSGNSIQKTLDKIQPGDKVQVYVGTYHETLIIHTDNVTLVGLSFEGERPVLNGIKEVESLERAVIIAADGVTVEGFVIQNYSEYGVIADNVKNLTLRDLIIRKTGAFGVLVDDIEGFTMQRVVTSEATAAAAYVLESVNLFIKDSEFLLSPYGLVVADCVQGSIENSGFNSNAVGLLVSSTPDAPKQEGDFLRLRHCRVLNNEGDSTPGYMGEISLPTQVPGGVGIAIVGADHTEVSDSIIAGNGACGVATYARPESDPPETDEVQESFPGVPDHTYFHQNTYADNGTASSEAFKKAFPGVEPCDIYWDGTGLRNQYQENKDLKTHPENLVVEQGGVHSDVMHFI